MAATIRYIPSSRKLSNDLKSPIIAIHTFACFATLLTSPQPDASAEPQTNHWYLHCQLSDMDFVRLDPSSTGSNSTLQLLVSSNVDPTDNCAKTCHCSTQNLTVENLLDRITSKSLDKYQFSVEGLGCRFWVSCLICFLWEQGHLIDREEFHVALDALEWAWDEEGAQLPELQSPICAGKFIG